MNSIFTLFESAAMESLVEKLGWLLLHSLWQFALIASLAVVGLRLMPQRHAAARYWLLILALATTLLAPGLAWSLIPQPARLAATGGRAGDSVAALRRVEPALATLETEPLSAHTPTPNVETLPVETLPVETPPAETPPAETLPAETLRAKTLRAKTLGAETLQAEPLASSPSALPVERRTMKNAPRSRLASVIESCRPWLPEIVAAWLVGVIIFSLRPVFGWCTVWRLQSIGVSPVPDSVQRLFDGTTTRLRVNSAVQVWQSTLVTVPMVVGFLKPMVLLPASVVTGLPTSQLEAILAHELAHVRRFDYGINVLQTLIETVYFYHPAIWWLSKQIRIEREHCCDDVAIATFNNRHEYGRALLAVAALKGSTPIAAVGMSGSSLQVRVRRLCGIEPAQASWASVAVCLMLALTTLAATALAWQPPDHVASDKVSPNTASPDITPETVAPDVELAGTALQLVESDGNPIRRSIPVAEARLGYPGERVTLKSWKTDAAGLVTITGLDDGLHYLVANHADVSPTPLKQTLPATGQPLVHKLQPAVEWHRQPQTPSLHVNLEAIPFGRRQFLEVRIRSISQDALQLPTLVLVTSNWRILIPARLQEDVFTIKAGFTQLIRLDWGQLAKEGIWQSRGKLSQDETWPQPPDDQHEFVRLQIGSLRTRFVSVLRPELVIDDAANEPSGTFGPLAVPPFSREFLSFGTPHSSELFYNRVPVGYSLKTELAPGQNWIPGKNKLAEFAIKAGINEALIPIHERAFKNVLARLEKHQGDDIAEVLSDVIADSERLPAIYHVAAMSTLMRRAHEFGDSLSPRIRNQVIWRTGLSGLKHADKIPLGVRTSLLWSATYAALSIPADQEGWAESRRELTRLWLASVRQVQDAMDPNWDPDPNNSPSISSDRAVLEQYSVQQQGRRFLERAEPDAEELICQLYIRPSVRLQQLADVLAEFPPHKMPLDQGMAARLIWTTDRMTSLFPDGYVPDAKLGLLQSKLSELDDQHLPTLHAMLTDDRTVHGIRTETVYGIGMKGHPSSLPALREFVKRTDIKGNPLDYAKAHIVALAGEVDPQPPVEAADSEAASQPPLLDRPITLLAKSASLRHVLESLGTTAKTTIELDDGRIEAAGISLEQLVNLDVKNERLEAALGRLLATVGRTTIFYMVDQGKIYISTLDGLKQRLVKRLPEWLRPYHGHGLLASIDAEGQVTAITMSGSKLDNELIAKLQTLPRLKRLEIESAKEMTAEVLRHIGAMPTLETLSLNSIPLAGDSLTHLHQSTSLRELSLRECQLNDQGISHLKEMRQLRTLRLGGNRLTDAGISHLKNLTQLEVLEIPHSNWVELAMKITDAGMTHVGNFTKLRELDIHGLGVTDEGFGKLAALRDLHTLNLGGTQITGAGLRHLVNFPQLESLSMAGTWIRDAAMEHVAACRTLKFLHLGYTRIGDEGFRHLEKLTNLERLSIDSRYVTDAGLSHIAPLQHLTHLELRASHVTDVSLEHIGKVKSLTYLSLSGSGEPGVSIGRNFTGAGYAHLATLPKLARMHLKNADVRWTELRTLKQLKSLSMLMPTMSMGDVRQLQRALPDTYVSAIWGGGGVAPIQLQPAPAQLGDPEASTPPETDSAKWIPAAEGIEYRLRQQRSTWRTNEIPLLLLDLRNRGSRQDLYVDLHQTQQHLRVQDRAYGKPMPWGGAERLPVEAEHVTIPFTLCDWNAVQEPKEPLEFGLGKHQVQFQLHIANFPPPGTQEKGQPFDLVTEPVVIEFIRGSELDDAAQAALDNIHRELIAFPRSHSPFLSPTLRRLVREHLPQSTKYLVDLLDSSDSSLHWPAAVTIARLWDSVPLKQIERYLQTALSHTIALRDAYPQGVDASIALGYAFRASYLGMPSDKEYLLETNTTHYLDGQVYETAKSKTSKRHGLGARTGSIRLPGLSPGPHQIQVVTDYKFTRGEFACHGQVTSPTHEFMVVAADTPDQLRAPDDSDVTQLVRESFKFAETVEDLAEPELYRRRRNQLLDDAAADRRWEPQMRTTLKDGTTIALHMPVWKLARSLPVDLCFRVEIHLNFTVIDGGELVVVRGQKSGSYFSIFNSAAIKTVAAHADERGQVPAHIVLKPSRAVALTHPKITRYYHGELASGLLRIFINGATPMPPSVAAGARDPDDISWGEPVGGLAIGLISTRTRPLGNTVPELLAFFRNKGDSDHYLVRSSGFFALELNGTLFGPFNLNGKSSQLTPGERLGPVTIEPARLRTISKLAASQRPADGAAQPRLKLGNNRLRVIYWHDNKPVYSGPIGLTNQP